MSCVSFLHSFITKRGKEEKREGMCVSSHPYALFVHHCRRWISFSLLPHLVSIFPHLCLSSCLIQTHVFVLCWCAIVIYCHSMSHTNLILSFHSMFFLSLSFSPFYYLFRTVLTMVQDIRRCITFHGVRDRVFAQLLHPHHSFHLVRVFLYKFLYTMSFFSFLLYPLGSQGNLLQWRKEPESGSVFTSRKGFLWPFSSL